MSVMIPFAVIVALAVFAWAVAKVTEWKDQISYLHERVKKATELAAEAARRNEEQQERLRQSLNARDILESELARARSEEEKRAAAHAREVAEWKARLAAAEQPLARPELEPLDLEEFRAAFDVEADHPLWQAVHQLLDSGIVKAVEGVEPAPSGVFSAEGRTHAAGELFALREFQKDLLKWQREARRARPQTTATE